VWFEACGVSVMGLGYVWWQPDSKYANLHISFAARAITIIYAASENEIKGLNKTKRHDWFNQTQSRKRSRDQTRRNHARERSSL
jgi:hypothetical protein